MKLNFDHNEFLDFVIIMMYNTIKLDDFMTENPRYNELRDKMELRGMKSAFFEYFLNSPASVKKEFRRFKDILKNDSKKPGTIFIYPNFEDIVKEIAEITSHEKLNEDQVNNIIHMLEERLDD